MEDNTIELTGEQLQTVAKFVRDEAEPLTPRQIVAELDKYIIGQDNAKKSVAIALRNRWRRQKVETELREEIMPNNIIMIGPTGVGKTEIARRLAKLANAPFMKVEATKYTEVGYVGRDVESMIRDLVERSVQMLRKEQMEVKKEEARVATENRILDILLPPVVKSPSFDNVSDSEVEENKNTREKFREMLRKGKLDNRTVEIDMTVDQVPSMQILGPVGMDEMGMNLQDLFGNIMP
ncbi:MAG: AAA family ATPase, partial [Candidatus Kapabacteria bacterium]|nr:AAA family ATPase [Candidatus Kapabacteria bacterium]